VRSSNQAFDGNSAVFRLRQQGTRFIFSHNICSQKLSEKGLSWGYGPGAGVPASAGSGHTPAEAGTPGALSGVSGHPACRGTDANHLFRQSFRANVV